MMCNAKIGVALVGGYLLGRTKKAKMAIGLGMFLAGKKLNLDPRQLGTLVANSPVLGPLNDQVRNELVDATKSAAGAALTQRMSGLADSLHERTLALDTGGTDGAGRTVDDHDPDPEDEPPGEAEDVDDAADTQDAADAGNEKPAPRRKTAAKSPSQSASQPSAKPAEKAAPAKKPATADRSSKARRSASSASGTSGKATTSSRGRTSTAPGRKTASAARGKASGAARTVADRGGRNG
ncbi:hypothetical protein ACGFWI_04805 [Streptomyces sp. NPDC048434]|uniref:hypothetical protein n=1 Tax=Streptomyces sp. NPDC048434 TaxID=3365549 RepID=UPI0037170A36